MEVLVTRVPIWDFMEWLEDKLNERYDFNLQGLRRRFHKFYNVIKGILEYTISLNDLFVQEKSDPNPYVKPLVDNCLNILKLIIQEYPNCLDLEFVEGFLSTTREKIDIYNANFHPITHFDFSNPVLTKKVKAICDKIIGTFDKVNDAIADIEKRAQLSVPLLRSIEDALTQFREPVKKLIEDLKSLKSNKSYVEYQVAFNELLTQMQKENANKKGDKVKKMINLIKEVCVNQLQLETMLDTPIKLCQIVKNKGKKALSEEKADSQTKLMKYVNLLVKPDFISSHLISIPVNELIWALKLLESQRGLVEELKKQAHIMNSGVDEVMLLSETEFKETFEKWKKYNTEMGELLNDSTYQTELMSYKSSLPVSLHDLRKFSEKLWEFQHSIVQYNKTCLLISKLKYQIQKFALKELHQRVELVCEEI